MTGSRAPAACADRRCLVEQYQSRVFRAAYAILGNRAEADQVAQQVFVEVLCSMGNYDGRGSVFAWMYRLTVAACCAMLLRRRDGKERFPLPVLEMPEPYRTLLLLRDVEGLSLAELADTTGLTEDAVRTALFQARRRLALTGLAAAR